MVNSVVANNTNANRLVKGDRLKFVDGRWSSTDGVKFDGTEVFLWDGAVRAVQRWKNNLPADVIIETPDQPLPDVEELNEKVPREEWVQGKFDEEARPPWQLVHAIHLTRIPDCNPFTYVNGTVGTRIAIDRLHDRVEAYQRIRGGNVAPLVSLDSKLMRTAFGEKLRPEFSIKDWRMLGDPQTSLMIEHQPPQIEQPKADVVKAKTVVSIGKHVKPITAAEEFEDSIPF
jgi:hypothetical protein